MTRLLALDPGESTGWSLWYYDALTHPQLIDHGTITGGVKGLIAWWYTRGSAGEGMQWDEVVSESFRLDGRTMFPNITPLRIEGALAVLWPDVHYQPNTMKAHVTDEWIKDHGLWWKGKGHDRDSLRHAFSYLKIRRHAPTLRLWGNGGLSSV